ncbi:Hsp70 family protein [Glycomyces arizonensis]|uniref:Hsp70 family protein n=1 Tax=Glycomyces arizonensis TaxID=256035 RepID=UPI00040364FC|nr:Hsp70 family protein [Glycomyces arizonensis]
MPADYLLSVDLGTSHTVAVVIWPDGRTRPLLFDGSPVMPSAVFLDEAGTVHVGRDAERLGPTAPERFEPNPKQRIADGTLLLGDRELPVTAAFAAILAHVARACTEAVGHLPRTVMTCPAAWSEQRRATLYDAAAQAGYQPVQLITEPVAAAHYYTTRLSHPLDPGQALAVFDFGGGTLDIAVVERHRDGSFGVLADGGLNDLGGLDFDAALVAHIGETVKQRDPDLWKRLEHPTTATELRDRRTLWNDVRGAKEMLSRSSVAPVAVPGMEQALHLTRGELDQLARPLLSRAVGETRRVLDLTGKRSGDLAGLFLVGGSSRMPLVAKVLHEELGIAPTVLEQPELPVSEGAAVAVDGHAPLTPPVMSLPPTPSPLAATSPPSPPPADETTFPLQMPGADKRRKNRRNKLIALAAAVVVLAVAAPLAWWYFTNPYEQRPFYDELAEVGDVIPYAAEMSGTVQSAQIRGDKAVFAYTVTADTSTALHVLAVDARTGEPLWDGETVLDGATWGDSFYASDELLAVTDSETTGGPFTLHFLDWETGEVLRTMEDLPSLEFSRSGDHLVSAWSDGNTVTVYDSAGEEVRSWQVGDAEGGIGISQWGVVGSSESLVDPNGVRGDGRIWVVTEDGETHVFDIESGEEVASRGIESAEDRYIAFNGLIYVTEEESNGYSIHVYDIDSGLDEVDTERVREEEAGLSIDWALPCGEERLCVRETHEKDETGRYTFRVYDAGDGEVAHRFDEEGYSAISPVGNYFLVEYFEGDELRTQVFDDDFKAVGESKEGSFGGIDGGSALAYPPSSSVLSEGDVIGLGVRDGTRHLLRAGLSAYDCEASDTHLACLVEGGMQIYAFREE